MRRAAGVLLANGMLLEPDIVVSNADPERTFLGLLGRNRLESDFARQVEGIVMDGSSAKVNLVLNEEPRVAGMPPTRS